MSPFTLAPRALVMDDARDGGVAWLFRDPIDWVEVRDPADVPAALARIDAALGQGLWVAGAFAFELGYLLEPKLRPRFRAPPDALIAVGLYRKRESIDGAAAFAAMAEARACTLGPHQPAIDAAAYDAAFARVQGYIAAGDVYQVNLTFPLTFGVDGDPDALVSVWRERARAGHTALFRLDDRTVYAFSPELFLASDGDGILRTRPMKGTAPRGPDNASDDTARATLRSDPKQRAENLMIVDLLRNDLARVTQAGSVAVTDLFTVESYPTLHTMTSGVEARLRPGIAPSALLHALFPCGSVTGAPKIRAMEIIADCEPHPRGFYCGALGAFGPNGEIALNVAIRTMVHERQSSALRMGVGGGIVYDSKSRDEYDEALLKARFVAARPNEPFDLLETMRWEPGIGVYFLDAHLARLQDAATYFGRPFHELSIRAALDAYLLGRADPRRVRLRLAPDGTPHIESSSLDTPFRDSGLGPVMRLAVADTRLSAADPFARHKTTRRALYDAALAEAKAAGADEALLLNEHGRVADGSFTTVFALIDGALVTTPSSEGALDGVLKRILADRATPPVIERPLTRDDLKTASQLYVGNSVRGLMPALLI